VRDERRLRTLARIACAFTVAVALADAVLVALTRVGASYQGQESLLSSLPDSLMTLTYAAVGVLLTLKRPRNLVGWALLLAGAGSLFGGLMSAYGELAVLARPQAGLPAGTTIAAVGPGSWSPLMAGVFLLLVTFPAGTLRTRRSARWVGAVLIGFALIWAAVTFSHGHLDPPLDDYENPLAVLPGFAWVPVIAVIVFCLVSIFVAGIDVVRRFRRSLGIERQQFKWLASSGGFLAVSLPFAAAFNWTRASGAIFGLALLALPVSVAIAVLRYRLYEIDRIISRTLVYAALTLFLGAAYVGLVLAGQALFSSFAGGSNLAIAVSTLVVAALFLPLRARTQRVVDRRFNRRRYDAQRTLEAFGARLREELDLETLSADLQKVVGDTMQPVHASVWLRGGAGAGP
jgi:hypothetical protein